LGPGPRRGRKQLRPILQKKAQQLKNRVPAERAPLQQNSNAHVSETAPLNLQFLTCSESCSLRRRRRPPIIEELSNSVTSVLFRIGLFDERFDSPRICTHGAGPLSPLFTASGATPQLQPCQFPCLNVVYGWYRLLASQPVSPTCSESCSPRHRRPGPSH
jgi:hypothetical protein